MLLFLGGGYTVQHLCELLHYLSISILSAMNNAVKLLFTMLSMEEFFRE